MNIKPSKPLNKMSEKELRKAQGQRLRNSRLQRGLLMKDLTNLMSKHWDNVENVSRLQGYENGTRKMPVTAARQLAEALNVSAAYLLCVDDTLGLSADDMLVLARYKELPDPIRDVVNQLLRITEVKSS